MGGDDVLGRVASLSERHAGGPQFAQERAQLMLAFGLTQLYLSDLALGIKDGNSGEEAIVVTMSGPRKAPGAAELWEQAKRSSMN